MSIQWNTVTWYSKVLAVVLGVAILFLGIWIGEYKTETTAESQVLEVNNDLQTSKPIVSENITPSVPSPKTTSTNGSIPSNALLRAWQEAAMNRGVSIYYHGNLIAFTSRLQNEIEFEPVGQGTGSLRIDENLKVLNKRTGELKEFVIYDNLAPAEMFSFLKNIPEEIHYCLEIYDLGFNYNETEVYGRVSTYYCGDDDQHLGDTSVFAINLQTGTTSAYIIPVVRGWLGDFRYVPHLGLVLYEVVDTNHENHKGTGLNLYSYNIYTKKVQTIVNYSADLLDQYCKYGHMVSYDADAAHGTCAVPRTLGAYFDDNDSVVYYDFLTRERKSIKLAK